MSDTDVDTGGDNEIVVRIEPELEAGLLGTDGVEKKPAQQQAETTDPLDDLKGQFSTLQSTLQSTSQQLVAAQTEAQQAKQEAQQARTEVIETRKDSVEQGIAAAKADGDAAETEYAAAMEQGDFKAAARAQRRMAAAETTVRQLTEAKNDLEVEVKKPAAQPRKVEQQVDRTEQYIRNFTPASQAWLRSHMDFVTDATKNSKLITAHHVAIDAGFTPDTPEYFEAVEKKLGLRQDTGKQQQTGQRRPIAPAAPVTPSGGGMQGRVANEVTLTPKEAVAAQDGTHTWAYDDPTGKGRFKKGDPIGLQEFARRKAIMTARGDYDKSQ